jgi:hypothetical protein
MDKNTDGLGVLGVLGGMDVSAAGLRNQSSTNEINRKAREAARELKYYAPQRALYEKYGKELEARRAGPSSAERLYEIGAALLSPTKSQGFGGTVSNLAPVMAAQRKAIRESEDAKSAMLTKYKMDVGELAGGQLKEEQDAQAASEKEQLAVMSKIYTAQNEPKFIPGVGLVYPNAPAASGRPANIPANYVYGEIMQNGRPVRGYGSPDGNVFIPDVGAR